MDTLKALNTFNPAKKAASIWDEFKSFAFKGNVVDLAVGVIIGAAFGTIVKSLVDNIIMPVVSMFIPSPQSYADWVIPIDDKDKKILIGKFVADILNFVII